MRVRMLVTITGTRDGLFWPPVGDTVDLPDEEAAKVIAAGHAEQVETPKKRRGAKSEDEAGGFA